MRAPPLTARFDGSCGYFLRRDAFRLAVFFALLRPLAFFAVLRLADFLAF